MLSSRFVGKLVAILSVIVLVVMSATMPVQAQLSDKQKQLFRDGIYRFNYDKGLECPALQGEVQGQQDAIPGVESDNARTVYDYFVARGLAPFRAAAFVGNFQQESGNNPRRSQDGGGPGRGLAQWSVDGRWKELQTYAAGAPGISVDDRDIYDIVLQLDFVWHELNFAGYKRAFNSIQAATTLEEATKQVSEKYEQPGKPEMEKRIGYAREALRLYGNGAPDNGPAAAVADVDPNSPGGTGSNGALGECTGGGGFSGIPGQTIPKGKGFTLADNTDYSATLCAAGSTETNIYTHPKANFKIRLCKIGVTGIIVASIISEQTVAMINAARAANAGPNGGAFRTYEQQYQTRIANGCRVPAGPGSAGCSPATAVPGNSQHERGLAIDFQPAFSMTRSTPIFVWLSANAEQYGFYNLPGELWHWSTSGN